MAHCDSLPSHSSRILKSFLASILLKNPRMGSIPELWKRFCNHYRPSTVHRCYLPRILPLSWEYHRRKVSCVSPRTTLVQRISSPDGIIRLFENGAVRLTLASYMPQGYSGEA